MVLPFCGEGLPGRCMPCLDCSFLYRELTIKCDATVNTKCGYCLQGYKKDGSPSGSADEEYRCIADPSYVAPTTTTTSSRTELSTTTTTTFLSSTSVITPAGINQWSVIPIVLIAVVVIIFILLLAVFYKLLRKRNSKCPLYAGSEGYEEPVVVQVENPLVEPATRPITITTAKPSDQGSTPVHNTASVDNFEAVLGDRESKLNAIPIHVRDYEDSVVNGGVASLTSLDSLSSAASNINTCPCSDSDYINHGCLQPDVPKNQTEVIYVMHHTCKCRRKLSCRSNLTEDSRPCTISIPTEESGRDPGQLYARSELSSRTSHSSPTNSLTRNSSGLVVPPEYGTGSRLIPGSGSYSSGDDSCRPLLRLDKH